VVGRPSKALRTSSDEHLSVFDTANKNGKYGQRFIHHNGHIKMMAAAQPFISGAISKTINMPHEVTVEEIENAYHTLLGAGSEGDGSLPGRLEGGPAAQLHCRRGRGQRG
jgi:ribonucleotide reductase alpha subunit